MTNSTATATHACTLRLKGGTILPTTCPVASHLYAASVSQDNAERAERCAAMTTSARQRRYSLERAEAMRAHQADSLRWADEATCTAA